MTFKDWTFSGGGTCTLDTVTKYSGNSCYKSTPGGAGAYINYLTHNTFLDDSAIVIFWVRRYAASYYMYPIVTLSTYGSINLNSYLAYNTWTKFRVNFRYDSGSNTKYVDVDKWVGSEWVHQTTNSLGTGAPAAGTLTLHSQKSANRTMYCWWDDIEVCA